MDIRINITPMIFGLMRALRAFVGIIGKPYETMRTLAREASLWEMIPIAVIFFGYFAVASLVKTAAFRPYLLTKQFILLSGGALAGFFLTVILLYISGKILRSTGTFRSIMISWAYTLYPTVAWFLFTSLLFLILPPPRSTRMEGIVFSLLYIIISTTILSWKIILSYLTIRFSLRFSTGKILLTALMTGPFVALYYVFLYRLGIFRVPFL